MKNDKIGVVGAGLIGGSIAAYALEKKKEVICFGRNPSRLKKALRSGICSEVSTDLSRAGECDIIFLSTPVDTIIELGKKIIPFMKKGALLTDVGSVKRQICASLFPAAKKRGVSFCGAHPMAGSEKTGFENARSDLFKGTVVFIAKGKNSSAQGGKILQRFWAGAGAECVSIDPEKHDAFTSVTSHLPHLIAFCFAESFCRFEKKHPSVRDAAAGSFESITRIAKSSPALWSAVFAQNRKALILRARDFRKSLDAMILSIEKKTSPLRTLKKISGNYEKSDNQAGKKNKRKR
ncbi:prephenate dehydrogenase [bacterium]|nr:prephenate dehydrogenase [Candidatus Omnitrophota bacterium]MBU2529331.1 prephenate dehydrogenase [bacterium]MBU3930289.1 prephenate dehydrogenase [bacterium]MBU4123179.1 prephenate dehydrogenase [bacterium]